MNLPRTKVIKAWHSYQHVDGGSIIVPTEDREVPRRLQSRIRELTPEQVEKIKRNSVKGG